MTRMERIIREIYRQKLMLNKDHNLGQFIIEINIQEFFDAYQYPQKIYIDPNGKAH